MADPGFKNLIRGQGQINDIVFGRGTNIFVEEFEIEGYEQNVGDYQQQMADQRQFTQDQLVPTTLKFKFNILNNYLLPQFKHLMPNFWSEMKTERHLVRAWRNDKGRKQWGSMLPIYLCNDKGETRVVYGRPGKIAPVNVVGNSLWDTYMAEFRRADTLSYSVDEWYTDLTIGADPQYIVRTTGDTDSWFRILINGPATNPVVTVGDWQIKLNTVIAADEVVEISSYPWQKRVVNNKRVNLSESMSGEAQYLDRLTMPINTVIPVRWTSEEYNTWIPALGNESWAEDIDAGEYKLPPVFKQIAGRTSIRFDLFNLSGQSKKFLGQGLIGTTSSIVFWDKKYNTADQYSEAVIVEPFQGRSAMVIMANDELTDGLALEVVNLGFTRRLRLRRVTSPTTLHSTILGESSNFSGWIENTKVSVEYNPTTKIFTAKHNGSPACTFDNSADLIATDATRRRQAFMFDIDGNLFTLGTGFSDIMGYDRAVVPSPTGRVRLLWRDAWVTV